MKYMDNTPKEQKTYTVICLTHDEHRSGYAFELELDVPAHIPRPKRKDAPPER